MDPAFKVFFKKIFWNYLLKRAFFSKKASHLTWDPFEVGPAPLIRHYYNNFYQKVLYLLRTLAAFVMWN